MLLLPLDSGATVEFGSQGWLSDWHYGRHPQCPHQDPWALMHSGVIDMNFAACCMWIRWTWLLPLTPTFCLLSSTSFPLLYSPLPPQERESQKLQWLQRCVEELSNDKWIIPALKQMKEICLLYLEVSEDVASYPDPFEKLEKRAWYPLFVHALN